MDGWMGGWVGGWMDGWMDVYSDAYSCGVARVVRADVRPSTPGRRVSGLRESCLGDFLWLVALSSTFARSFIFWTASVEPVPPGCSTAFLTAESSTTVGRVHCGGSDPLSSLFSRRQGSTVNQSRQFFVSLTDPPLTRTPRTCASGGSPLVCLNHNSNQNSKAFLRR